MDPVTASMIAAIGSGVVSGASGAIAGSGTKRSQKRQFNYQTQLNQQAYDQNLQMWNMANEYNTPSAQVQRLKEAGINPVTAFGSGSNAGNAGPGPTYTPPDAPNYAEKSLAAFQSMSNSVLNMLSQGEALKRQRIENKMAEVDLLNYLDVPGQTVQQDGNTMTISRQPGLGSLKRSERIESLRRAQLENFLLDTTGQEDRLSRIDKTKSEIDLNRSRSRNLEFLNRDIDSKIGLRSLDSGLKQLELQWYNSSKFMRNISPVLQFLKRR